MLTLLGSLLGFIGSLVPDILKFFREKSDRMHELKIMDRQMEVMKIKHTHALEEIRHMQDVAETRALYQYPMPMGVRWVDALSGSVRPVITYAFFILYWVVKLGHIIFLLPLVGKFDFALLPHIWHEEDQALFAAVMSFWFGQRALSKYRKYT